MAYFSPTLRRQERVDPLIPIAGYWARMEAISLILSSQGCRLNFAGPVGEGEAQTVNRPTGSPDTHLVPVIIPPYINKLTIYVS